MNCPTCDLPLASTFADMANNDTVFFQQAQRCGACQELISVRIFEVVYCCTETDDPAHDRVIQRALNGGEVSPTGRDILRLRRALGVTMTDAARIADVNRGTVWSWENGVVDANKSKKAHKLLNELRRQARLVEGSVG